MAYKIYKLFLKILSSLELILIIIVFVSILFLFSESAFSKVTSIEKNLAYKYCDSLEKNLFKGLDNEKILKYEYFFNSINIEAINGDLEKLSNFPTEVEIICSYKLSNEEKNDIKNLYKEFNQSN
tara:strand:- start:804 stop:1178 length:375 start_codon:yes stop_codon:yes gene_type:complete